MPQSVDSGSRRPPRPVLRRLGTFIAACAVAVTAMLMNATPSHAATGYWWNSQNTSNPAIFQTNWAYYGTAFNSPAGTPPAATISSINYQWAFIDPPPTGLQYSVFICRQSGGVDCINVSTGTAAKSRTGTAVNPAFSNHSAVGMFQYVVFISDATTHVINPAKYSSYYSIQVNYTY